MRLGRRSGLYRRRWMRRERVCEKGNDDFDAGRENDHYHRERSEEDREEPPRRYTVNAMRSESRDKAKQLRPRKGNRSMTNQQILQGNWNEIKGKLRSKRSE